MSAARWFLFSIIALFMALCAQASFAYYSVLDTGEILSPHHYDASLETEFETGNGSGANVVGRFDAPIDEESQIRAMIGGGTNNFQTGAFYKWVPIPDVRQQPAIGLIGGVIYGQAPNDDNTQNTDYLTLRVAPILSKAFRFEFGELTPYASLPIGVRLGGTAAIPAQLVVGSELKTPHFENIRWRTEMGFNLNKAYSYISLNAVLTIDDAKGIEFK